MWAFDLFLYRRQEERQRREGRNLGLLFEMVAWKGRSSVDSDLPPSVVDR